MFVNVYYHRCAIYSFAIVTGEIVLILNTLITRGKSLFAIDRHVEIDIWLL